MASPASSAPAMPKPKPPKPPKLLLDKTHGPHPDLRSKFKSPSDFKKMYRAFQWLQGYDLRVADETSTSIRLACATHPTCPFTVTALYTIFTEPPVAGKPGFYIQPTDFNPKHDHPAPYIPMDQQVENQRRAKLQHDDPSLENPPLVPVQGFAGSSDSDEPESEPGRAPLPGTGAAGAGNAPAYGFASAADDTSRATPSARGGSHQPPPHPSQLYYTTDPRHQYQAAPPAFGSSAAAPYYTYYTGTTTTTMPQASHAKAATTTTYLPDTVMRAPLSTSASPAAAAAGIIGATTPPLAPPSSSRQVPASHDSGKSNPTNPTTTTLLPRNELETFLLEISPAFADYFHYFKHLLPLDTSVADLLSLDNGLAATPEDHTVFNLFREIKELPLLLVAMAADGVRKANIRSGADQNSSSPVVLATLNPRIAEGLEKARAEKWVRDRLRDGQAVLLAREATTAAVL